MVGIYRVLVALALTHLSAIAAAANADDEKCKENTGAADALSGLSVKSTGGPAVVTTKIASVFAPGIRSGQDDLAPGADFFSKAAHAIFKPDALTSIGFDATATLPAGSTASTQYLKQELLNRRGGIINGYFSAAGRGKGNCGLVDGVRASATDHYYFLHDNYTEAQARSAMLAFISTGIGLRGVTTNRSATSTNTTGSTASNGAIGTVYLGFGMDGPLYKDLPQSVEPTAAPAGYTSFEVYAAANVGNTRTISAMFAANPPRVISDWGVSWTINLPGSFALSAEYSRPIGRYGLVNVGDLFMVSFGYNKPATTTTDAQKAQAAGAAPAVAPAAK